MAADIPDPFLFDDDDEPLSTRLASPTPAKRPMSPAHPGVLRGLRAPSLFLPIPSADPLNPLLGKLVPSEFRPNRDVTGEWAGRGDHELIMSNSWRALARKAEEKIRGLSDQDSITILNLWYLRLTSLSRMRLYNQAAVECANLWAALESQSSDNSALREYIFGALVPFELLVFRAWTTHHAKDAYEYLDQLAALRKTCVNRALGAAKAKLPTGDAELWKERGSRIGLLIASQLLEMQDFRGAQKILDGLAPASGAGSSAKLLSALGRLKLEAGDITTAATYFNQSAIQSDATPQSRDTDAALLATAKGDWTGALALLEGVVRDHPDDVVALNSMSVVLLCLGRLEESIGRLESILRSSPSTLVVAEPLVFNLSTLYELRSATSAANKRELLIETAKWSGDGFRAAALKFS